MIDRLFSATLTFAMLAAGTVAIGSEFIGSKQPAAQRQAVRVVQLPTVHVVGKRVQPQTELAGAGSVEPVTRQVQ